MIDISLNKKLYSIAYDYIKRGNHLLFCIHGLGGHKEHYKSILMSNKFSEFSILAIDLIGFGQSTKYNSFSYSMKDHKEICSRVLEKFDEKKITLVGHSMGGAIAVLLADNLNSRCESLINIEGNLIYNDCTVSKFSTTMNFKEYKKYYLTNLKQIVKWSNELGMHAWLHSIKESDAIAFFKSSQSLVEWSEKRILLKQFLNLPIKKCYVYGDKNRQSKVIKLLDNIEKIEIAESGHFPMIDNSEQFNIKISEFLKK